MAFCIIGGDHNCVFGGAVKSKPAEAADNYALYHDKIGKSITKMCFSVKMGGQCKSQSVRFALFERLIFAGGSNEDYADIGCHSFGPLNLKKHR